MPMAVVGERTKLERKEMRKTKLREVFYVNSFSLCCFSFIWSSVFFQLLCKFFQLVLFFFHLVFWTKIETNWFFFETNWKKLKPTESRPTKYYGRTHLTQYLLLHIIYVACVRKVALPWRSKASYSSTSKAGPTCRALAPRTCPLFLIKKQNGPFIPSLMNMHHVHKTSLVKFSTIGPTFFLMTLTKFTYHVHKPRIFSLFINVIYFVVFLLHF